ncbi:hypothetical protein AAY473_010793 [Plecturocebus cupreus]
MAQTSNALRGHVKLGSGRGGALNRCKIEKVSKLQKLSNSYSKHTIGGPFNIPSERPGTVAHACNSSTLGGLGRTDWISVSGTKVDKFATSPPASEITRLKQKNGFNPSAVSQDCATALQPG